MRVALLTRDPATVASARVRLLQYVPGLRATGAEVRTRAWTVASRADLARFAAEAVALARWADVTVLQKPRLPGPLLGAIDRLSPIVVDFDDAVWASADGSTSSRFGARLEAAVDRARVTVAGSRHLARWAADHGAFAVEVIPSSVELHRYPVGSPASDDGRRLVLGWIGTPGNLRDFSPPVRAALAAAASAVDLRLRIISSEAPEVPGVDVELVPWSPDGEAAALADVDVGLLPLLDDERSRGRCSLKAVQYGAVSRPVVASPVGSAPEVVVDGETGILARGESEWTSAIRRLAADEALRAALGRAGRRRVEQEYSVTANLPRWRAVLERAVAG